MNYVLLAGLLAILVILLFLIHTVRNYGTAIHSIQSKLFRSGCPQPVQPPQTSGRPFGNAGSVPVPAAEAGISGEVVAAISAAVYCAYPGAAVKFIRRAAPNPQSAWKMAGLLENTRPF